MAKSKVRVTEQEWLAANEVVWLDLLNSAFGQYRKFRLFGCACARRGLPFLSDPRFAEAILASERFADARLTWDEMKKARKPMLAAYNEVLSGGVNTAASNAASAVYFVTEKTLKAPLAAPSNVCWAYAETKRPDWDAGNKAEEKQQMALARDIFINPYLIVTIASAWRIAQVVALAEAAYEERALPEGLLDPIRLTVLADALEEAGCTDPDLLGHLRSPGPHVRGCWALDLVLGKT
jgi:hypothetical protein